MIDKINKITNSTVTKPTVSQIINRFEKINSSPNFKSASIDRFWDYEPKSTSVDFIEVENKGDDFVNIEPSNNNINKSFLSASGHPLYSLLFNVGKTKFMGFGAVLSHSKVIRDLNGNIVEGEPLNAFASPVPGTVNIDSLASVEGVDVDCRESKHVDSYVYGFNGRTILMTLTDFNNNYSVNRFKSGYVSGADDITNPLTPLFNLKDGHYEGRIGERVLKLALKSSNRLFVDSNSVDIEKSSKNSDSLAIQESFSDDI